MRRSTKAFVLTLLGALLLLAAKQEPVSIATLISRVRTALEHHDSDNKLAGELRKLWLAQRLDDHTIEELESEGAGPKSVAELLDLRDAAAHLPAPTALPSFPAPPLPMRPEQDEVLKLAASNAASYTASLPDFICDEIVHRYEDIGGRGTWKARDVLKVKLTYFGGREEYKLVEINNRPTTRGYDYESVG